MPPRPKKTAPHDRPNNNSQGLAAPGRRIAKQKSNPHLDGQFHHQSNGHPRSPLPSAASAEVLDSSTDAATTPVDGTPADAKMGASHSHQHARSRGPSGASEDDLEAHRAAGHTTPTCTTPLRIDVGAAGKSAHRHRVSTLALSKTILAACPLWDVLAILIILLQLPPTIVSVVHFLFVALTFVTPTSPSLQNLPTVNEILVGSGGAPSLPVIVTLDVLALIVFCMTTVPMQNVGLDIAQAVIAISLGGAAASRGGTARSVSWCLLIIVLSHLFRWRSARQFGVSLLWTGLIRTGLQPDSDPPTIADPSGRLDMRPGWSRSVLGVHILVQGLVRMVRRYLLWRDAECPPGPSVKKVDPEAGSGSASNTPRTNAVAQFESANDSASTVSTSTDGRPPGPSPAPREGKDKSLSSRKKRRQATHVRSQQPFWAALASTKVTFIKEYEQSQTSVDSLEADSADLAHLGNAEFASGGERVWIRDIGSSEALFGIALPSSSGKNNMREDEPDSEVVSVSRTRPFYLRLNGASWNSLRVEPIEHEQDSPDGDVDVWLGKIFGLTAYSPYFIEFVRLDNDAVIYAASLITLPAPSTEQVSTGPAPSQTLRPSSPTTTLKNSIAAAEQNLESLRNRLKRHRKDHKALISSVQKEVDSLSARVNSGAGSDDRHRSRIKQLEQGIRRAEEDAEELEADAGRMGTIPESETKEWAAKKAMLRKQREQRNASMQAFQASKAEADGEFEKVQSELQTIHQKHQKSQQRQAKFSERHENLVAQKAQAEEDKMRRALDRSTAIEQRAQEEQKFLGFVAKYQRDAQNEQVKAAQLRNQIKHLEDAYFKAHAARQARHQSVPTTPDGPLPGTAGNRNSFPFAQGAFTGFPVPSSGGGMPEPMVSMNGNLHYSSPTSMYQLFIAPQQRGRSSSMLSGMSGFTDDVAEDHAGATVAQPLVPPSVFSPPALASLPLAVFRNERRKSSQGSGSMRGSGSGSGSGSGNSSTRDPMSPAPKTLSPVGPGALPSPISPPPKGQRAGSH